MGSRHESDVLVIGTGGAGLRAAIEAHEKRADVLVVCKSPAGYNNATVVSGGGFRAAMGGSDAGGAYGGYPTGGGIISTTGVWWRS